MLFSKLMQVGRMGKMKDGELKKVMSGKNFRLHVTEEEEEFERNESFKTNLNFFIRPILRNSYFGSKNLAVDKSTLLITICNGAFLPF